MSMNNFSRLVIAEKPNREGNRYPIRNSLSASSWSRGYMA